MSRRIPSVIVFVIVVLGTLIVVPKVQKAGADEVQIGIKAGDWIRYDYAFDPLPDTPLALTQWVKIECLSVEESEATVRFTRHMSSGFEDNGTFTWRSTGGLFQGHNFLIPANSQVGDTIYMYEYGDATIADETSRTYLGVDRTALHTSHMQLNGIYVSYYWDKATGVMLEEYSVGTGAGGNEQTATIRVAGTNLWQALFLGLPIDPMLLYVSVAVIIIVALGATVFFLRRRKKLTEAPVSTQPTQL